MFGIAKPVQYIEKMPSLLSEDEVISMLSGSGSMTQAGLMDKLVYTKSSHWKYEQEWRISPGMGWSQDEPFEDLRFRSNELDGVMFGQNTSLEDRREITELSLRQNPDVSFHIVKPAAKSFSLEIADVM